MSNVLRFDRAAYFTAPPEHNCTTVVVAAKCGCSALSRLHRKIAALHEHVSFLCQFLLITCFKRLKQTTDTHIAKFTDLSQSVETRDDLDDVPPCEKTESERGEMRYGNIVGRVAGRAKRHVVALIQGHLVETGRLYIRIYIHPPCLFMQAHVNVATVHPSASRYPVGS